MALTSSEEPMRRRVKSINLKTLTMPEIRILFNRPQLSVMIPPSNPPRVHPPSDIDKNNADLNLYWQIWLSMGFYWLVTFHWLTNEMRVVVNNGSRAPWWPPSPKRNPPKVHDSCFSMCFDFLRWKLFFELRHRYVIITSSWSNCYVILGLRDFSTFLNDSNRRKILLLQENSSFQYSQTLLYSVDTIRLAYLGIHEPTVGRTGQSGPD